MCAENQVVLFEMVRDKEECRINEKVVARTKDQDKEYAELDEVLIVSEKQGLAEEEMQKEKESAQVGNIQSKKDAETSFIQPSELKTPKKESNQEPDIQSTHPEQDEPEFKTSHTSQRIGQQRKDSEGQSTRNTEDVEPMEHSPAGVAGSGPSVTPRFPGAQGGIWLSVPLPSPTPAMGPGIPLEEIELKERLSDSAKYPNKLELVWEMIKYYYNVR